MTDYDEQSPATLLFNVSCSNYELLDKLTMVKRKGARFGQDEPERVPSRARTMDVSRFIILLFIFLFRIVRRFVFLVQQFSIMILIHIGDRDSGRGESVGDW